MTERGSYSTIVSHLKAELAEEVPDPRDVDKLAAHRAKIKRSALVARRLVELIEQYEDPGVALRAIQTAMDRIDGPVVREARVQPMAPIEITLNDRAGEVPPEMPKGG